MHKRLLCIYIYIYVCVFQGRSAQFFALGTDGVQRLDETTPRCVCCISRKDGSRKILFVIAATLIFTLFLIIICYPAGLDLDALL